MPTDLIHTQGTKFSRGAGSPTLTYTVIARLIDAAPPGKKRKTHDTTTLDQADNVMQKIGSRLVEQEPIDLEFLMTKEGLDQLDEDMDSPEPVPYKLEVVDGTYWTFPGLVTSLKPAGKMDDLYKVKATIELAGKATKVTA